jgi:hypothetical protein
MDEEMRLSDFVREALTEIAFGIHEAKVDSQMLVAIVPGSLGGQDVTEKSYVEFDIAVTTGTTDKRLGSGEASARAGINVFSAKVSVEGKGIFSRARESSNSTVSRLTFKVPVYFNAQFRADPGASAEREFVKQLAASRRINPSA